MSEIKQDDKAPRAPMRRSLRILLGVSLALNLLVAGLVVGAVTGGIGRHRDHPHADRDFAVAYFRALPARDKIAIGRDMRQRMHDAPIRQERPQALNARLIEMLKTVPFDADGFGNELSRFQQDVMGARAQAQQAVLARIATMSDAERSAYADRVQEILEQRRARPPRQ